MWSSIIKEVIAFNSLNFIRFLGIAHAKATFLFVSSLSFVRRKYTCKTPDFERWGTKGPGCERSGVQKVRRRKVRKKRSGCKRAGFLFVNFDGEICTFLRKKIHTVNYVAMAKLR
jgi:hypothetical protein